MVGKRKNKSCLCRNDSIVSSWNDLYSSGLQILKKHMMISCA